MQPRIDVSDVGGDRARRDRQHDLRGRTTFFSKRIPYFFLSFELVVAASLIGKANESTRVKVNIGKLCTNLFSVHALA